MSSHPGRPSDSLPEVLELGDADVAVCFVSMSERHPDGLDAEYLEWHLLDHEPEQHRLRSLRASLRVVSTPECRAARLVSEEPYDRVDHVMSYLFADREALAPFGALGAALFRGDRMPIRLPSVEVAVWSAAGAAAAPRIGAGSDVVPWRPSLGVYVLVERAPPELGVQSSQRLIDVDGVAGSWWYGGGASGDSLADTSGLQLTCLYLDEDPVAVAERLRGPLERRWAENGPTPLLAAPFHTVRPFDWRRHLP